jgi:hypothetical protein
MPQASVETKRRQCQSCSGTGELGTDSGVVDCPDCGGSGLLPHPHTLAEWRMRDIEREHGANHEAVAADVRWLIAELRRARAALTEIIALAQDGESVDAAARIKLTAVRSLEFYEIDAAAESAKPAL